VGGNIFIFSQKLNPMMFIVNLHSFLAWALLVMLVASIVVAIMKSLTDTPFRNPWKGLFLATMIISHLQIILGIVLYFTSSKVVFAAETMSESFLRFFALEHPLLMIIAAIVITMGYSGAKRIPVNKRKFRKVYIFYIIGFVLVLLRFPWQYLGAIGAGWFV
jgi:predicted acyltransferase